VKLRKEASGFISVMVFVCAAAIRVDAAVPSVPRQISVQGKVTDAGGAPLLDGVHSATFAIYTASSGGSPVWTEGPVNVTTGGGLFSHNLGSVASLPINLEVRDSLWLQITFDGLDMSPRVHLVSSPSAQIAEALEVRSPNGNFNAVDTDQSGRITTYDSFTGKALTRLHGLDYDAGGNEDGVLMLDAVDLDALESDVELTSYQGHGQLILRNTGIKAAMSANLPGSGGTLQLMDGAGVNTIVLSGGQTGDNAVVVPNGSISGGEILDASITGTDILDGSISGTDILDGSVTAADILNEPGIASNSLTSTILLDGSVQTLLSRNMIGPAPGYVLVIATAQVRIAHDAGTHSVAYFGVSSTAGAFTEDQIFVLSTPAAAPTGLYSDFVTVHALFSTSGGIDDFNFLGEEVSGGYTVDLIQLSLAYFPVAHGVFVSPSSTNAGEISLVEDSALENGHGPVREGASVNEVDVRQELAAVRSHITRLEAILTQQEPTAEPED